MTHTENTDNSEIERIEKLVENLQIGMGLGSWNSHATQAIHKELIRSKLNELKSFIEYRVVQHSFNEPARSVSVKKIEERIKELEAELNE